MVERYGLKFNPFPRAESEQYRNNPEMLEIILFDAEKGMLDRFAKELTNTSVSFAVIGPWGTGKTLFLLYFYRLLRQKYGADLVKFIYVKAPSDVEDMINRISSELGIQVPRRQPLSEAIELLRRKVNELVNKGFIIYIAIDQLEETYRNIEHNSELISQLVEVLRGKLSAMIDRKYALGISMIDIAWYTLTSKWPSLAGIDTLKLRRLEPDEVEPFIIGYLERARDPGLIKKYNLEEMIKSNPTYPFMDDAIAELNRISKGVQRSICSWAGEVIEKSANKFDKIDSFVLRLLIDRKTYLRQRAMEEILPYHPQRVPMIIREILSYIWIDRGAKYNIRLVSSLDKLDRDTVFINIGGRNLVLLCIARQTVLLDDLQRIARYLSEGITMGNEKINIDSALIVQVVPRDVSYGKLVDPNAIPLYMKLGERLKHVILYKDSVDEWGRIVAFYLAVMDVLYGYFITEDDKDAEIRWIMEKFGLTQTPAR
jgi:hypothetical protein